MPSTKYALVVDDIEHVRNGIAEILKQHGYQVTQAVDGNEALEYIARKGKDFFSLITMDYQMPIKDGAETIEAIRKQNIHTPIICISASLRSMQRSLQEKNLINERLYFIDKEHFTEELPRVLIFEI